MKASKVISFSGYFILNDPTQGSTLGSQESKSQIGTPNPRNLGLEQGLLTLIDPLETECHRGHLRTNLRKIWIEI